MSKDQYDFTPPKDFRLPEGKGQGDTFDLVCTFKVEAGGKLCLTKLGDTECCGDDDKDKHAPNYQPLAKSMVDGMAGGAPNPNSY